MSGAKGHQTRPITNSSHYLYVKPPKMPTDMNYSFHLANIPPTKGCGKHKGRDNCIQLYVWPLSIARGTDGVMRESE